MDWKNRVDGMMVSFAERLGLHGKKSDASVPAPAEAAKKDEFLSPSQIALSNSVKDPFLSLVTMIESNPYTPKPHKDPGGPYLDVGFGYCITKRIKAHSSLQEGKKDVFDDLTSAGLKEEDAKRLIEASLPRRGKNPDLSQVKDIEIPLSVAVNLVGKVRSEYEKWAAKSYGSGWDKLPDNKKAVASYLAYKDGNPNKHEDMIASAKRGNMKGFHMSISSSFAGKNDDRAVRLMKSMSESPETFSKEVMAFEGELNKLGQASAGIEDARRNLLEGLRNRQTEASSRDTRHSPAMN